MNQMQGIQTVREALRLENYPMDRSAVYYTVGDIVVFDAKGAEIPVRDLLDRSNRSEFWSADEVIAELERCMPTSVRREVRRIGVVEALGWLSIALGVTELLAPRAVARASGLGRRGMLVRACGLREIITGIGLLTQEQKTPWLWARTAGDVLDLVTISRGSGSMICKSAAAAMVGLVGVTDLAAALREQRAQVLATA